MLSSPSSCVYVCVPVSNEKRLLTSAATIYDCFFLSIFISFHLDWNGLCWNAPASKIIDKRSHSEYVIPNNERCRSVRFPMTKIPKKKKNRKSKIKNVSIYQRWLSPRLSNDCVLTASHKTHEHLITYWNRMHVVLAYDWAHGQTQLSEMKRFELMFWLFLFHFFVSTCRWDWKWKFIAAVVVGLIFFFFIFWAQL